MCREDDRSWPAQSIVVAGPSAESGSAQKATAEHLSKARNAFRRLPAEGKESGGQRDHTHTWFENGFSAQCLRGRECRRGGFRGGAFRGVAGCGGLQVRGARSNILTCAAILTSTDVSRRAFQTTKEGELPLSNSSLQQLV